MWKCGWARVAVVAASLCSTVALASPAEAYTWPGESANHTAVLAAMVIGQSCRGSLSRQERVEIRSYLTAKRREHEKQQADPKSREANPIQQDQLDGLAQALGVMLAPDEVQKAIAYYGRLAAEQQAAKDKTGAYPPISWTTMQRGVAGAFNRKFGRARSCDAGTLEFARDMAKRVRTAVAAEAWLALSGRPLGKHGRFGDAIVGRVIGRKCAGVLSAEEAGELQSYIERTLADFARTAQTCGCRGGEGVPRQGGGQIRARLCRLRWLSADPGAQGARADTAPVGWRSPKHSREPSAEGLTCVGSPRQSGPEHRRGSAPGGR